MIQFTRYIRIDYSMLKLLPPPYHGWAVMGKQRVATEQGSASAEPHTTNAHINEHETVAPTTGSAKSQAGFISAKGNRFEIYQDPKGLLWAARAFFSWAFLYASSTHSPNFSRSQV